MTNRQLAEWLAKGNGQMSYTILDCIYGSYYDYKNQNDNEYVYDDIRIRSWNSEEWIQPTIDIYERDCKGELK